MGEIQSFEDRANMEAHLNDQLDQVVTLFKEMLEQSENRKIGRIWDEISPVDLWRVRMVTSITPVYSRADGALVRLMLYLASNLKSIPEPRLRIVLQILEKLVEIPNRVNAEPLKQ